LAQGNGAVSKNEELDAIAEFMAQLDTEQMEKLNDAVNQKKTELAQMASDEKSFAQIGGFDYEFDYDASLF